MDLHARIHAFLQQQTAVTLTQNAPPLPDSHYLKAGVVPFVRKGGQQISQETITYLMMKPVAKRPKLDAPAFQICKGTRMHFTANAGWTDVREGKADQAQVETLLATALREGVEELGLKLESIASMVDVGPYQFASAKTGHNKYMWLFAVQLRSTEDLLPMEQVEKSTDARGWLSLSEFETVGRADHRPILRDIAMKLEKMP